MNRLIATRLNITKDDLTASIGKPLKSYSNLAEVANFIDARLRVIAQNHFGVYETMISEILLSKVKTEINKKYLSYSLEEIDYCYERASKREKIVVLTYDDWIKPLQEYFPIKHSVNQHSNLLLQEMTEEEESKIQAAKSLAASVEFYRECLATGIWTGCYYRSMELAKSEHFKGKISHEQQQIFFEKAREEKGKIDFIIREEPLRFCEFHGYQNHRRIAAKMYVQECINLKIEI